MDVYLTVDLDIVWSTVHAVLPGFKAKIAMLLEPPAARRQLF